MTRNMQTEPPCTRLRVLCPSCLYSFFFAPSAFPISEPGSTHFLNVLQARHDDFSPFCRASSELVVSSVP